MKKNLLVVIVFLVGTFPCQAQFYINLKAQLLRTINKDLSAGDIIEVYRIDKTGVSDVSVTLLKEGQKIMVPYVELKGALKLDEVHDVMSYWKALLIRKGTYYAVLSIDNQFNLRTGLEEECEMTVLQLMQKDAILEDAYIEDYLHTLLYKLYPSGLNDNRKGSLHVKVVSSPEINASCLADGTILVNTGLLAAVNSEDELLAILAHEVAHYVLDHSLIQIVRQEKRIERAMFWTGLVTGLASVADVAISQRNRYYMPGTLTNSVNAMASIISTQVVERLGISYSREQEREADEVSAELLKMLKKDPATLSNVLAKIRTSALNTGDTRALVGSGTHPGIDERIALLGWPKKLLIDRNFDQKMSLIISHNAMLEFSDNHYNVCDTLLNRIFLAGVPTEDDYLLKARVLLSKYDTPESNQEALSLMLTAKSLSVYPNFYIDKFLALCYYRLKRKSETINSFQQYLDSLNKLVSGDRYEGTLAEEKEWVIKMIYKAEKL